MGDPELRIEKQVLRMTSPAFLPSKLGTLMVPAGGCSGLTLGTVMGYKGESRPLGTIGPRPFNIDQNAKEI